MLETTVMQAKRYGVFSCTEDAPLHKAARWMAEEDISTLVVVDPEGYLTGIITRTDLIRAYVNNKNWASQPVGQHMRRDVVTVGLATPLREVAGLLLNHQIHRAVVVRHEGEKVRPVAVISLADLIYHMVRELQWEEG